MYVQSAGVVVMTMYSTCLYLDVTVLREREAGVKVLTSEFQNIKTGRERQTERE